jgi:hypothetical protein
VLPAPPAPSRDPVTIACSTKGARIVLAFSGAVSGAYTYETADEVLEAASDWLAVHLGSGRLATFRCGDRIIGVAETSAMATALLRRTLDCAVGRR